jgi:hypothetical protein
MEMSRYVLIIVNTSVILYGNTLTRLGGMLCRSWCLGTKLRSEVSALQDSTPDSLLRTPYEVVDQVGAPFCGERPAESTGYSSGTWDPGPFFNH